jgi:hypothetical protein
MIKINNNYKENFYYRDKIVNSFFTFTALKKLTQLLCIRNIRANLQEYKKNKKAPLFTIVFMHTLLPFLNTTNN